MIPRAGIALVCLAFAAGFAKPPGARFSRDISRQQKTLSTIREDLKKKRLEIKKLSSNESKVIGRLSKISETLTLVHNYLGKLSETETALHTEIDSIKISLGKTTQSLKEKKASLRHRVKTIYTRGRLDNIDLLLGASSFSDFLTRYSYFRRITENDKHLIQRIFSQQQKISTEKTFLEERLAEVLEVATEKQKENKKFKSQRSRQKRLLKKVKGKKKTFLKLAALLQKREKEINKIIEVLELARKRALETDRKRVAALGSFAALKGIMPWPLKGRIIRRFGINVNKKYLSKTKNNGIDIRAALGQTVQAVANGIVAYTGQMGGLGNFLILQHKGGYYTLYGNLSSISVETGEKIGVGEMIGIAGETGSFEGKKLHFEVRKERKVLDPAKWLSKG